MAHPPSLTFRGAEAMGRIVNAADWQAVAGVYINCRNQTWEPPSLQGKQVKPICSFKPPWGFYFPSAADRGHTQPSQGQLRGSIEVTRFHIDFNLKYYSLCILGDHVAFENYNKSMQSAILVIQSDSRHEIHSVTCGYADIHLPVELNNWMHRSCPIHLCTDALY